MWTFNYILIGNSNVGKSSICNRLIFDKFFYDNPQTIGIDYFTTTINDKHILPLDCDPNVKIKIWDTAGCEMYKSITRSYYNNCCGVILVYDVCDHKSFIDLISYWIPIVKTECPNNVEFIFVATKIDSNKRILKPDDGKRLALEHKTQYFEIDNKKCVEESGIIPAITYLTNTIKSKLPHDSLKLPKGIKYNKPEVLTIIEDKFETVDKSNCCFL